jgi:hypothetical protein
VYNRIIATPIMGENMLRTRNLTLSGTASLLTITDAVDTPSTISVQNTDASAVVYLGGPNVTSSSYGVKLAAGQIWSADLGPYDDIYAVGTAGISVLILER